jgi:hypothetical protein
MNKQKVSCSDEPVEVPQYILQEYKDWRAKKIRFSDIGQKKYTAMKNRFNIYGLHQPAPRRKNTPDKQKFDEDRKKRRREYMRNYFEQNYKKRRQEYNKRYYLKRKQKLLEQSREASVPPRKECPSDKILINQ